MESTLPIPSHLAKSVLLNKLILYLMLRFHVDNPGRIYVGYKHVSDLVHSLNMGRSLLTSAGWIGDSPEQFESVQISAFRSPDEIFGRSLLTGCKTMDRDSWICLLGHSVDKSKVSLLRHVLEEV